MSDTVTELIAPPAASQPTRRRQGDNNRLAKHFLDQQAKVTGGKAISLADLQADYRVHAKRVKSGHKKP